jgi:hypothetical protein
MNGARISQHCNTASWLLSPEELADGRPRSKAATLIRLASGLHFVLKVLALA